MCAWFSLLYIIIACQILPIMTQKIATYCHIFTAPDTLDAIGSYIMNPLADYPPPVKGLNDISNMVITNTTTVICYNQTIYDDNHTEEDEFFSLTLTAQDRSAMTTLVDPQLSSAVIRIVDDDGKHRKAPQW